MASDRRLIALLILISIHSTLAQSPIQSPAQSPVQSPAQSPVQSPAQSPSPGTPGEGRGEGDFGQRTSFDNQNHPNPLPEHRERGPDKIHQHWQLLHLPGIGGERMIDQYMVRGLVSGLRSRNIQIDAQIYDWTEDEDGLLALSDPKLHDRQSTRVARLIEKIRLAHPNDFFLLTSHSGGAGIAAWALEKVSPGVAVDEWLMLSAAVSPRFDLSAALMHVDGPLLSFNSALDPVLGVGTRMFGTVDRRNVDAGGRVGFVMPMFADPIQYAKLINVPYSPAWLTFGDSGDHIGVMRFAFAQHVLAPSALTGEPKVEMKLPPSTTAAAK